MGSFVFAARARRAAIGLVVLAAAATRLLGGCGSDDDGSSGGPPGGTPEAGGTPPPLTPPPPGAGDAGDDGPASDGARPPVPGLDPMFGNGGFANVDLGGASVGDTALFVFRQSDGKIVAFGNGSTNDLLALRVDATGKLDPTFGDGGRVQIDVPHETSETFIPHAAMGSDDKLVISVGLGRYGQAPFGRIYRLDTKGALDATFGTGGHVDTPTTTDNVVTVQADGKILFAGNFASDFIVRYTSAGALDMGFGTSGVVTLAGKNDYFTDIQIAPSGKIVLGGYMNPGGGNWLYTATRLGADGSVDGTFGTSGRATATVATGFFPYSLAVQSDEKVLLAGGEQSLGGILVRFDALGNLDTTFDGDGVVNASGTFHGLSITSDGHVVSADDHGTITRFNSNGSIDKTFPNAAVSLRDVRVAADGTMITAGSALGPSPGMRVLHMTAAGAVDGTFAGSFGGTDEQALDAVVMPDNRILVVGSAAYAGKLVAFTPNGALDGTFGSGGILTTTGGLATASSVGVDSAGRIVMAGGGFSDINVWRFAANGAPDTAFGSNGVAQASNSGNVQALVAHSNGNTYLAGGSGAAAGAMVWSFAPDGKTSTSKSFGGADARAFAIATQADGKLVVTGYSTGGDPDVLVTRLDATTLTIDTTFGGGGDGGTDAGVAGLVKLALSSSDDVGRGVTIAPDGKILVVGSSSKQGGLVADEWQGTSNIFVARLDTNGVLDGTFGTGGIATPSAGGNAWAYAARIQSDGSIFVAGRRIIGERSDAVLLKLGSTGALDTTYATGGVRTLTIGNESGLRTLTLLPDGKPLASGYVHLGPGGEDVAVFRFVP